MNDTLSNLLKIQDTRTPMVDGHPKEAGTECPLPNWTFSVQLPLHIIQSWMTSKTAHKPRKPQAGQLHTEPLKSALWPFWWPLARHSVPPKLWVAPTSPSSSAWWAAVTAMVKQRL